MHLSQSSAIALGLFVSLFVVSLLMGVILSKVDSFFVFALVGGTLVFIFSFVNVQIAVYILIFATLLSPEFGSRSTSGSGVTLRVDDMILILICFAQLTKSAIYQRIGLFSQTPLNRYISFYMIVCMVSTGIGMLAGRVPPLTGFFFVAKYFQYFVIYYMVVSNLESKREARGYLYALFATAAIVSLMAMSQIPAGDRVSAPFEGEGGEPNTLGGYLLLITSVVGGLLLVPDAIKSFKRRMMLYTLIFMMVIPILFTLSRATWLSAIPMLFCFWLASNKKIILAILIIGLASIAPLLMPAAVKERLFYTFEKQQSKWALAQQEQVGGVTFDTSSSARIRSWQQSLEAIPEHPILGFGVQGWRFIDAQYFKVAVETGLVGLTAFMLLLFHILKNSWQSYRTGQDPLYRGISLGFFIGTIAMIAHATMTNTFIIVRIMEPFCIIMAIVIGVPQLEMQEESEKTSKRIGQSKVQVKGLQEHRLVHN